MKKLKENKKIIIIISVVIVLITSIILILNLNKTKEYEIIFTTDGGTTISGKKVLEGGKVQKPEDPKKEGYLFVEWTLDGKTFDFSQEITKDMKLEAKWYKIEKDTKYFTVKFDSVGGTTISNQIIEEGQIANKPKNPIKEGYIFEIWTLNNEEYEFEQEVTKDITLIAKYVKKGTETTKEENIKVETPTLTNASGSKDKGIISANLNIVTEGYYSDLNNKSQISGFELYEKINNEYNLIDTKLKKDNPFNINVIVDIGENKTYVAKAFVNKNNKKIYSSYSNEIVIDNSKIEKPTLKITQGSKSNTQLIIGMNIVSEGHYNNKANLDDIKGYELYEKTGNQYKLIDTKQTTANPFNSIVTIDIGENRNFVARAYALNKSGKKVYSAYSNVVNSNNSKIETPTLKIVQGSQSAGIAMIGMNIVSEGHYNNKENIENIKGYELYEKIGNEYKLIETKLTTANPFNSIVTIDIGENKKFVARAYALNKSGKKVYSAYSNEVNYNNQILTPTLKIVQGSQKDGIEMIGMNIVSEGHYNNKANLERIVGYELYEKIGNQYKLIDTKQTTSNPFNSIVTIDIGENRNFIARAYALNKSGKKVYSAYSNIVNINNSKVEIPTLKIVQGSGNDEQLMIGMNIVSEGYYNNKANLERIVGYELYEKVGNEYKLIDTKLKTDNPFNSIVTINVGESKKLVARAYALNKSNQKVYSAYSNEVSVSN